MGWDMGLAGKLVQPPPVYRRRFDDASTIATEAFIIPNIIFLQEKAS
jgi:hypothetical protein